MRTVIQGPPLAASCEALTVDKQVSALQRQREVLSWRFGVRTCWSPKSRPFRNYCFVQATCILLEDSHCHVVLEVERCWLLLIYCKFDSKSGRSWYINRGNRTYASWRTEKRRNSMLSIAIVLRNPEIHINAGHELCMLTYSMRISPISESICSPKYAVQFFKCAFRRFPAFPFQPHATRQFDIRSIPPSSRIWTSFFGARKHSPDKLLKTAYMGSCFPGRQSPIISSCSFPIGTAVFDAK